MKALNYTILDDFLKILWTFSTGVYFFIIEVYKLSSPLRILLLKMENTDVGKHVKERKGEQKP